MSNPYGYEGQTYGPQSGYGYPPPPRAGNNALLIVTLLTVAFLMFAGGGYTLFAVLTDDPSDRRPTTPVETREAVIQPSQTPPESQPTQNSPSPPPATNGQVLLSDNGTTNKTTAQFTVDATWQIHYTYDCSANPIGTGHVSAAIKSGAETIDTPLTEIGTKADKTTPLQTRPGTFTLEVTSILCSWTIEVIDVP
ncbi:hypothetical protein Acor_72920 [Acrocarpospora corrugata]|uniref:Uncharacterized protein n=1 Tax=Acrocarpospora corrugata TaxID=35763 RepID=A0A5M3W8N4_9ACTN|nr:hypothetical protein [Acrocarpospora corrugata]GES05224.1 hypothetical protein Acor_72920 [Acrocarpospora corrugata]